MDFNKFWNRFKKDADPEKLVKAVREVQQRSKDASEAAKEAERAYFENVEKKKGKVSARIAELNERCSAIETEFNNLKYLLTTAMVDEDSKEMDRIRGSMEALEKEKARIKDEVELFQTTYIRGADDLYRNVKAKHAQFLELKEAAQEVMRMVHEYDFAKRYDEVHSCCYYWNHGSSTSLGIGADMELINKNYNAEDNVKHASEETKRRAEQIERWQAQGPVRITQQYNDPYTRATPGYNPNNSRSYSESSGSSESLQLATERDYSSSGGVGRAGRERPARNDASSAALSTEENGLLQRAAARAQTLFRR